LAVGVAAAYVANDTLILNPTRIQATGESMAVRWPWKAATNHLDDGQPSFMLFYPAALHGLSG
jgi:hypothetical protein